MTKFNTTVDKQSPQYQQNLLKTAQYNLLIVLIFTVLNLVMLLAGTNSYFLFSATIPYYLTYLGYMFDHFAASTYTLTGLTMSVVFVAAYGVFWFMCRKDERWFVPALVLFAADTVAMLMLVLMTNSFSGSLIEIVVHVWVLVGFIRAISASKKLKVLAQEPPVTEDDEPETLTEETDEEILVEEN